MAHNEPLWLFTEYNYNFSRREKQAGKPVYQSIFSISLGVFGKPGALLPMLRKEEDSGRAFSERNQLAISERMLYNIDR